MNQITILAQLRRCIRYWYGQAALAALIALICFISMYGVYLHLSNRLPDGTKIYEKTGLYAKKNWNRGVPTSTIGGEASYCMVSAFTQGRCGFEGSGKTVTAAFAKFPNLWGDVDVVLNATSDKEILSDYGLNKCISIWIEQSIFDVFFYSFWVFLFAFLGLRGLNKQFSKD